MWCSYYCFPNSNTCNEPPWRALNVTNHYIQEVVPPSPPHPLFSYIAPDLDRNWIIGLQIQISPPQRMDYRPHPPIIWAPMKVSTVRYYDVVLTKPSSCSSTSNMDGIKWLELICLTYYCIYIIWYLLKTAEVQEWAATVGDDMCSSSHLSPGPVHPNWWTYHFSETY